MNSRNMNFFQLPKSVKIYKAREIKAVNLRKKKRAEHIDHYRNNLEKHQTSTIFDPNWIPEDLINHNELLISDINPSNKLCILIDISLNSSSSLSFSALTVIDKFLQKNINSNIQHHLFNEKILLKLKQNLKSQNNNLQLVTIKIFSYLIQILPTTKLDIKIINIFPVFIDLLKTTDSDIFTKILEIIYNYIINHSITDQQCIYFLNQLNDININILCIITNTQLLAWILKVLPYDQLNTDYRIIVFKYLPWIIDVNNEETVSQGIIALYKLSFFNDVKKECMFLSIKIMKFINYYKPRALINAIKVFQNVIEGGEELTQGLVDVGIVDKVIEIFETYTNDIIKKEACICLKLIIEKGNDMINIVVNKGCLSIKKMLMNSCPIVIIEGVKCLAGIYRGQCKEAILKITQNEMLYDLLKIACDLGEEKKLQIIFENLKDYCKYLKGILPTEEWDKIRLKFFNSENTKFLDYIENKDTGSKYYNYFQDFLDIIENEETKEPDLQIPEFFSFC
ncbi:hypothetical protein SteCoe_13464 [Stentor coeruleus]|uniref:IBB domain-containing protein n=1 Tax=Stentor coeruleus TaxID=5963 RepID=A0A1R2C8B5_9CILI|nr:hypothetical protein SteCoe_13464 [Stentor coeruleus]